MVRMNLVCYGDFLVTWISAGLDKCSNGFIMSSYMLLAHVWVRAAPKNVALQLITCTERAVLTIGSPGMYEGIFF